MTNNAEFESIGEPEVRRRMAAGEYGNVNNPAYNRAAGWLALKDAEAASRRAANEASTVASAREANSIAAEALSSSREANKFARNANIWAATAAMLSAIAIYIAYVALTGGKP